MRKIFFNDSLQKEFDKNGFVVIDLLSPAKVPDLLALYELIDGVKGTVNTNRNTYELSFFEKDVELKKKKFNSVYKFFKPLLDDYLVSYSPIMINVFSKQHGIGEVPVHQNWTFVDEEKYTSVSVWCPLQDVSRKNGTLEVVPGSHKVTCGYRGPTIPWVFDNLNQLMKDKYMIPLELHVGQVAILDDSIIHFSGDNHTENDRRTIQLIMKPAEVPTIHCYKDSSDDEIYLMDVDDDYFFDFDMWRKPKPGKNQRKINFSIKKISEEELLQRCNKNLAVMT